MDPIANFPGYHTGRKYNKASRINNGKIAKTSTWVEKVHPQAHVQVQHRLPLAYAPGKQQDRFDLSAASKFTTSSDKPRETRKIFSGVRISQPKSINRKIDEVFRVSKNASNGPKKMIMSLKRQHDPIDTVIEIENADKCSRSAYHDTESRDENAGSLENKGLEFANSENQSISTLSTSEKYRIHNNKRTRWDVGSYKENYKIVEPTPIGEKPSPSHSDMDTETSMIQPTDVEIPSYDCDDELQSDDDVVGPWHNSEEPIIESNEGECSHSDSRVHSTTQNGHPQFESTIDQLKINADSVDTDQGIKLLANEPQSTSLNAMNVNEDLMKTERRNIKIIDRVDARKAHRNEKVKPTQPPTKSSFARKTDMKMRQKKTGTKKGKGKKKAKKIPKKSIHTQEEYSTTGAFLTRGTVRQLADAHGFQPNSFNYHYMQLVEVLNINGSWYSGKLMEMDSGKVRVRYTDWKDYEWIIIGSRRLRPINEPHSSNIIDLSETQQNPPDVKQVEATVVANAQAPANELNESLQILSGHAQEEIAILGTSIDPPLDSSNLLLSGENKSEAAQSRKRVVPQPYEYRTTGAFATRNAMRELADSHGFIPNAYGFTYQCQVEVQNVKKFWENGHLVQMDKSRVKVRYDGWDEDCDEWFPIGSRRLRLLARPVDENVLESLLIFDSNPEMQDAHKASGKHKVIGPNDEFWLKEARRLQEIEENKKRRGKAMDVDPDNAGETNVENSKTQDTKPLEYQPFSPNIYGYYLMQHVHILQMDRKFYEARLVAMANGNVKVHYCGWNAKLDEAVPCGSPRIQQWKGNDINVCVDPDYAAGATSLTSDDAVQKMLSPTDSIQPSIPSFVRRSMRERKPTYKCREESPSELSTALISLHPFGLPDDLIDGRNRHRKIKDQIIELAEYYQEPEVGENQTVERSWVIYCKQCKIVIKKFRYYCTYCEWPTDGQLVQNFDLCLRCFDQDFPFWHDHPRSGFAVQAVLETKDDPQDYISPAWEEDVIDDSYVSDTEDNILNSSAPIESDEGYKYLKQWRKRKICALCNDDDITPDLGGFVGPFIIETFNRQGNEKKKTFWIHDACGRYSPEVVVTKENKWYNVTVALRRGRGVKCGACKEKGATIGCFDGDCNKSFHVPCARKPVNYFKKGVIFWCPGHEEYYNKKDTYVNIFHCDQCNKKMEGETWFSCLPCSQEYFTTYDICSECYERNHCSGHEHDEDCFEETSMAIIKEMEAEKAAEKARKKAEARAARAATKKCKMFPRRDQKGGLYCSYCNTQETVRWRKGFDGVLMCEACFELASLDLIQDELPLVLDDQSEERYVASIEDYSHKPYLTREALSSNKFDDMKSNAIRLASYAPTEVQLFSLSFDSTYFDIPGRAPRWASHSGTDYHGTWLPQTVRRAILRHTRKDERILSNFLGRGTDAIECFLLQRRCCGIDINPAAVSLSQRSCSFEIPPGLTTAEHRPIIVQADSRKLTGALFTNESYDHILSHPPYKDCVAYSLHIEGDLSRYTNPIDFQGQYEKCVKESWRLLKMGRRLTLGIGDNREHCFYVPVGFQLIRLYMNNGFELEELIIKRQRYCSAFGLGTYLCVQFDFLVFTHEFIATFKKVLPKGNDTMDSYDGNHIRVTYTTREIPRSPIARKSVVMGTVWIFKPSAKHSFSQLCTSRMVERFGKDESNWEHIEIELSSDQNSTDCQPSVYDNHAIQETEADTLLLSNYELERQRRIEENRIALLQLGLISDLSEESSDFSHYEAMIRKAALPAPSPLSLRVIPHIPSQLLKPEYLPLYRENIVQMAQESVGKLAAGGMFIVGTQDYREPTGKLWPLGVLIMEDINRNIGEKHLKLKEMVVTVPEGYSKDRSKVISYENYVQDICLLDVVGETERLGLNVPIVHAVYLIFMKMDNSQK
ncbi:hypothetical protein INT43_007077 [Umbelopsis isabellina]|uniref:PHD-type domain-containing protein n=1 Tax=Mortierella isabellina TaxID=91625 RepID=A0A8H7UGG6_MORIS|nr:hypothetical protein INT43_007077 [Umbelopsis isabellina]